MCEIFCKSFWIMYDGSLVNWRPGTWLLILENSFLMQASGKSLCEFTLQCRWWAPQPELRSRRCLAAREHVAGGSSGGVLRERARSCFAAMQILCFPPQQNVPAADQDAEHTTLGQIRLYVLWACICLLLHLSHVRFGVWNSVSEEPVSSCSRVCSQLLAWQQ